MPYFWLYHPPVLWFLDCNLPRLTFARNVFHSLNHLKNSDFKIEFKYHLLWDVFRIVPNWRCFLCVHIIAHWFISTFHWFSLWTVSSLGTMPLAFGYLVQILLEEKKKNPGSSPNLKVHSNMKTHNIDNSYLTFGVSYQLPRTRKWLSGGLALDHEDSNFCHY